MEIGLLFLTIARFGSLCLRLGTSLKEVLGVFTSVPGILAIAGGAIATYMNGKGLDLLKMDPQMIIGLVIGSIFGISFCEESL